MNMDIGDIDITCIGNVMQLIAKNEVESFTTEGLGCTEQAPVVGRIDADAAICGTSTHIDGARHKVSYVFRLLAASMSPVGVLANHLVLSEEDLNAARTFVDAVNERSGTRSA